MAEEAVPGVGGFGGPQVCALVGITYRQLDYWARTGLLRPSIAEARGSGTKRRYSYHDVLELKVIKQLLDAGISLQSARRAVECLREDLGPTWRRPTWCWRRQLGAGPLQRRGGGPAGRWPGGLQHRSAVGRGRRARRRHRAHRPRQPVAASGDGTDARPTGLRPPGSEPPGADRPTRSHPSRWPAPAVRFAHPSERLFAALLDFYEHRWEYEPVEFVLRWNEDGHRRLGLPTGLLAARARLLHRADHADQRLVTRKNAKVRRMRELYPEVDVKVVYQRDFLALLAHARASSPSPEPPSAAGALRPGGRLRRRATRPATRAHSPSPLHVPTCPGRQDGALRRLGDAAGLRAGTVAEHRACRSGAVAFDVSHLGTVRVDGPDAFDASCSARSPTICARSRPGRAQYTHLLDR